MAGVKTREIPVPGEEVLRKLPADFLLGLSGGVDSCALLAALLACGRRPVVLHFNHGWRRESGAEEAFVRRLTRKHRLRVVTGRAVRGLSRTESAAREARWTFFSQVARRTGIAHIVLAHHANDQVETFLWQLLRGGGSGARGMRPIFRRGRLQVHRPWLGVWKREIMAYVRRERLAWREDASNMDIRHMRNRLRRRVLPYLRRQCGARVEGALWRAAEILAEDQECLDALCAPLAGCRELSCAAVRREPVALQRRILRLWLEARGIQDVGLAEVEAVRGLLEQMKPAKINLPGNRHARRRSGVLFLE